MGRGGIASSTSEGGAMHVFNETCLPTQLARNLPYFLGYKGLSNYNAFSFTSLVLYSK